MFKSLLAISLFIGFSALAQSPEQPAGDLPGTKDEATKPQPKQASESTKKQLKKQKKANQATELKPRDPGKGPPRS